MADERARWLAGEVSRWVDEGLIDADRGQAICTRYEMEDGARTEPDQGRLITVLALLGSLMLGTGGILFVASNWDAMTAATKVVLVIGALASSAGGGYWLRYGGGTLPRIGAALLFLSALFYGAGIWLMAQTFHVQSHFPNGFLAWGVGVLAMAWAVESVPLLALATVLTAAWTAAEQVGGEVRVMNLPYWLLALGGIAPLVYRLRSAFSLNLLLMATLTWIGCVLPEWAFRHEEIAVRWGSAFVILVGLAFFSIGAMHPAKGPLLSFRGHHRRFGAVLAMGMAYLLTFVRDFSNYRYYYHSQHQLPSGWAVALWLAVPAVIGCGLSLVYEPTAQRRLAVLGIALSAVGLGFVAERGETIRLGANVLLFAMIVGFIWIGYQERTRALFNAALGFFALDLVTRYFDWFYEMMPRSLFFMGGGVALLVGGALLEKSRRKVLADWTEVSA